MRLGVPDGELIGNCGLMMMVSSSRSTTGGGGKRAALCIDTPQAISRLPISRTWKRRAGCRVVACQALSAGGVH